MVIKCCLHFSSEIRNQYIIDFRKCYGCIVPDLKFVMSAPFLQRKDTAWDIASRRANSGIKIIGVYLISFLSISLHVQSQTGLKFTMRFCLCDTEKEMK